ncbi:MAG: LacI family DNA-binding transcriptional regulator [Victivallaceae bacterium]|nr:LacI family DNA-binding transcriptional regulator [Victivallaceae bacterium]
MLKVSMKDLADELNVSKMTVSRALRNHPAVSEETRNKVLKLCKKLNYRHRLVVQDKNINRDIPLVLFNPNSDLRSSDEMLSRMLKGYNDALRDYNYRLSLHFFDGTYTIDRIILELFANKRAGIIIHPFIPEETRMHFSMEELIDEIHNRGVPCVIVGNYQNYAAHTVMKDTLDGGYIAARHLLQLGHRNIAFVSREPAEYVGYQEQLKGYKNALAEFGVSFRDDFVLVIKGRTLFLDYFDIARELIELRPKITAIFAVNDYIALGTMQTIMRMGVKVPADISIVGYDNIATTEEVRPKLSSVEPHLYERALKTVEILCDIIDNPGKHPKWINFTVKPELIVRESSGISPRLIADKEVLLNAKLQGEL